MLLKNQKSGIVGLMFSWQQLEAEQELLFLEGPIPPLVRRSPHSSLLHS